MPLAKREHIGRTTDYVLGRNRYLGYLISLATRSFQGVRVGLDCANGSASQTAKSVFDALGAKTYALHNEPDGTNINDGCGSTHIEELQKFVVEKGLDVGFAYDGDADRCLAVDEKGNIVDGDQILYLCGKYLAERGELEGNTVVATVMSNIGLRRGLEKAGISYEQTAVGDKYVSESMQEHGYSLGGEQSGHIIFSKYATTGDGVLTSLKIMEVMLEKKQRISSLLSGLKIFPQLLVNVRVADKGKAREDAGVKQAVTEAEAVLAGNGRVLLRESGTEPLIRVMVEAENDELCRQQVEHIVAAIRAGGHEIKI